MLWDVARKRRWRRAMLHKVQPVIPYKPSYAADQGAVDALLANPNDGMVNNEANATLLLGKPVQPGHFLSTDHEFLWPAVSSRDSGSRPPPQTRSLGPSVFDWETNRGAELLINHDIRFLSQAMQETLTALLNFDPGVTDGAFFSISIGAGTVPLPPAILRLAPASGVLGMGRRRGVRSST